MLTISPRVEKGEEAICAGAAEGRSKEARREEGMAPGPELLMSFLRGCLPRDSGFSSAANSEAVTLMEQGRKRKEMQKAGGTLSSGFTCLQRHGLPLRGGLAQLSQGTGSLHTQPPVLSNPVPCATQLLYSLSWPTNTSSAPTGSLGGGFYYYPPLADEKNNHKTAEVWEIRQIAKGRPGSMWQSES